MDLMTLNFEPVLRPHSKPYQAAERHGATRCAMHSRMPARTDFSVLRHRRVLCLLDEDNLRISLKKVFLRLSFDRLLNRLDAVACRVSPWVVLTASAGDYRREDRLVESGWRVLSIPREIVTTHQGPCVKANADMDLCFLAGNLLQREEFDAVLFGSGDGDLCVAVARGVRRLRPATQIHTLSVRGTSSSRLRQRTDLFDSSILIGRDLLAELNDVHQLANQLIPLGR